LTHTLPTFSTNNYSQPDQILETTLDNNAIIGENPKGNIEFKTPAVENESLASSVCQCEVDIEVLPWMELVFSPLTCANGR